MEKLKMHSPNLTQNNIARIRALFPNCVTEAQGEDGKLKLAVDFDQLRQELADTIVDGTQERYHLNWPGKREALLNANLPIGKTLRPYRSESVDFDSTQNLFIEGDNLDALKLIQETYLGKIRLIYIDPPYNTGKDFVYEDNYRLDKESYLQLSDQQDDQGNRLILNSESRGRFHSAWISMMYSRLKLARNLLSEDGVIFISIDEGESANLKKICEEIFGVDNFVGDIVWKNSSKNDQDYISIQHEYIFAFVKNKASCPADWKEKKEGLREIYAAFESFKEKHGKDWSAIHNEAVAWYKKFPESNPIYASKHYSWMDDVGVYFASDISGPNVGQYVYDVKHPKTGKNVKRPARGWSCPEDKLKELIEKNLVHFGVDENSVPCLKTYLRDTEYKSLSSIVFKDGRAASKRLRTLFGEAVFTNPKDEDVLKGLMKAVGLKGNDIVLDFFAGSSTTAHAVFDFNVETGASCRTIMMQIQEDLNKTYVSATGLSKKIIGNAIDYLKKRGLPENICELSKERIRLAGVNLRNGAGGKSVSNIDVGFRILKIDSSNMADIYYAPDALDKTSLDLFVDNLRPGRSPEDLLFQVMLDWGVDLSLPIAKQTIQGKEVFFVDGNVLAACFDKTGSIDEAFVKELAKHQPLRVVFRDAGYKESGVKINVEQIFKLLSPATEVKCI